MYNVLDIITKMRASSRNQTKNVKSPNELIAALSVENPSVGDLKLLRKAVTWWLMLHTEKYRRFIFFCNSNSQNLIFLQMMQAALLPVERGIYQNGQIYCPLLSAYSQQAFSIEICKFLPTIFVFSQ